MFATMRTAVGIPRTSDILDHIYTLPTPEEQEAAMEKIRTIEREAMISQTPQPGLLPLRHSGRQDDGHVSQPRRRH